MSEAKIALITGASRGLGRNTALSLARHGVHPIVTYHSRKDEANSVVREIESLGAQALALQLDTAAVSGFPAFTDAVRQALGTLGTDRFDYLVNNAGTGLHKSIADTSETEFDALCNIHFKGSSSLRRPCCR